MKSMSSVNRGNQAAGLASSLALMALVALSLGAAQDIGIDPFDSAAFDAASGSPSGSIGPAGGPGGGSAAGQGLNAARTEYLVGGAVAVSSSTSVPSAFDGYATSASAGGKLFAKVSVPDYGSLYISYNVTQAFLEGLSGTGAKALAPAASLLSPTFTLGELHYSFDLGKVLFARIGKQLIAWGPSRVWSPVDFINLQRADSFAAIDLRQGKPGLRLHLPMGKANAFLFADFSGTMAGGTVLDPVDSVHLAARLDATLGGFELGLTGFAGSQVQAKAGLDFSGDLLGFAVYGELAWAPGYSSYEDSYMGSLGFSRALGDLKEWTVSAEGFWQSTGADYTGDAVAMAARTPLYMGGAYGYVAIAAADLFSPHLATTLSGLANLTDLSWIVRLAQDFSFPRAVPFTLTLSWVGGGADKEFTLLGGDNSLALSLRTRIEF